MVVAANRNEGRFRVSRRGFLKASGAGLASAGAIGAVPFANSRAAAQQAWDAEHDVVVVGTGAAGFAAAITARGLGADVLMLEKGTYVGGTTIASGGTMWIPNNTQMREAGFEDPREDAIKYMARYSWAYLYNENHPTLGLPQHDYDMISAYYDKAAEAMDFIQGTGAIEYKMSNTSGPTYNLVQTDYQPGLPQNKSPQGRSVNVQTDDGSYGGGGALIGAYQAWAEANGIGILLNHRVERVIINDAGDVVGVEASVNASVEDGATPEASAVVAIRAKKGVIFGSGGYRQNAEMMHQLSGHPYYGGCSTLTNEGDFLVISSSVNAKLGNLHGVWRNQGIFEQAIAAPTGYNCSWFLNGDSFVIVNKYGRRFMNEKNNYQDRPLEHLQWDSNEADYANRLGIAIWDTRLQENWGGSFPWPLDPATAPYVVTGETLEDLSAKLSERFESLVEVSGGVLLSDSFPETLASEIERFNGFAAAGVDDDFHRGGNAYNTDVPFGPSASTANIEYPSADQPNVAMYPISGEGPYYACIFSPAAVDSNGGPVINPDGQVTRWDGSTVEGLYGAGNCVSSPSKDAYYGAGMTLGSCHIFGYAAAVHAVASAEKSI